MKTKGGLLLTASIWLVVVTIAGSFPSRTAAGLTRQGLEQSSPDMTPRAYLPYVCKGPSRTPLPYALYGYVTFSKITQLPLEDLSDYTNILYAYHSYRAGRPDQADLEALREAGMGILLKLDKRVVEETFDEAELRALKARIDPYKDVILALCVIDEPYKPSRQPPLTEQELATLVDEVKAIFPEYTMYVNFLQPAAIRHYHGGVHPGVPENIDLISFDTYYKPLESEEAWYKDLIGKDITVIKEETGDRPVVFVSLAFRADYEPPPGPDSEPPAYQAQWDYELYVEHDLAGLAWFFYDATVPEGTWYGAAYFPELIAKHKEIGQRVLGGAPTPPPGGPTTTSFMCPWCRRTILPSTLADRTT
jgi:hypothetical protein